MGGPAIAARLSYWSNAMSLTSESSDSVFLEFKDVDSNPDTTRRPVRSSLLRRLLSQQLFKEGAFRKYPDDLPRVLALAREQEESCRRQNDLRGLSHCLGNQAFLLKAQGALAESLRLHEEAKSVYSQLG